VTVTYVVLLGAVLLIGVGALITTEARRWALQRRRTASSGCPRRLVRLVSPVGDCGRRRGVYGPWPVQQPGRLLHSRRVASRRAATRGYHGGNRLRDQGRPRRLRDCGCAGTRIGRHGSDSPAERDR
jgi:hypothetical protein